jgi:hypothetical protein
MRAPTEIAATRNSNRNLLTLTSITRMSPTISILSRSSLATEATQLKAKEMRWRAEMEASPRLGTTTPYSL